MYSQLPLFQVHLLATLHDKCDSRTQPLLDCILYLMQYPYDPGTLPSSANQSILGNVYLRSNLSRKCDSLLRVGVGRGRGKAQG